MMRFVNVTDSEMMIKRKLFIIVLSTGHENNVAQPKADKCLGSTSHFSPFFT